MTAQTNTIPKPGQRVACVHMYADLQPIAVGARGTVLRVQEHTVFQEHHIAVAWDDGRTLTLLSSVDKWEVLGNE